MKALFKDCKKADKNVKLPELPKCMVELLPPEGVKGPKEPPGMVCFSVVPLRLLGENA